MDRLIKTLCIAVTSLTFATSSLAQTDGSLGNTSTGTSTVSVTIQELIQINDVDNLQPGASWNGVADGSGNGFDQYDDLCIFSNASTSVYNVTLTGNFQSNGSAGTGAGGSTNYYVKNTGNTDTIAYSVSWNADDNDTGAAAPNGSGILSNQGNFAHELNCADVGTGLNARVRVKMTAANMLRVRAGTYSGTLTILVQPN